MACSFVPGLLADYSMAMKRASQVEVPDTAEITGRQPREEKIHVLFTSAVDDDMAEDERACLRVDLAIGVQNGEAVIASPGFATNHRLVPMEH